MRRREVPTKQVTYELFPQSQTSVGEPGFEFPDAIAFHQYIDHISRGDGFIRSVVTREVDINHRAYIVSVNQFIIVNSRVRPTRLSQAIKIYCVTVIVPASDVPINTEDERLSVVALRASLSLSLKYSKYFSTTSCGADTSPAFALRHTKQINSGRDLIGFLSLGFSLIFIISIATLKKLS